MVRLIKNLVRYVWNNLLKITLPAAFIACSMSMYSSIETGDTIKTASNAIIMLMDLVIYWVYMEDNHNR